MEKVDAYKCAYSGRIFEDPRAARRCEFETLMRNFGGNLPCMGPTSPITITDWLAPILMNDTYIYAVTNFLVAADYLREHRETLVSDRGQQ